MKENDAMGHTQVPFSFPTSSSRVLCSFAQEALSALAGSAEIYPPRACPCSPRFAGEGGEVRQDTGRLLLTRKSGSSAQFDARL